MAIIDKALQGKVALVTGARAASAARSRSRSAGAARR